MLRERILTACLALPVLALCLYLGGGVLLILAFLVVAAINYEFFSFATPFDRRRKMQLSLCSILPSLGYLVYGFEGYLCGMALGVITALSLHIYFIECEQNELNFRDTLPATLLGIGYTGFIGGLLVILARAEGSNIGFAWLLLVVMSTDTSAYFGGHAVGRRKLSPRVSPNKTVEGALCGLLGAIIATILGYYLLNPTHSVWFYLCYGLLASVLAQVGDLVESMVKRIYGVKDASNILPGHGGILDRLDGILFAAPILFFIEF